MSRRFAARVIVGALGEASWDVVDRLFRLTLSVYASYLYYVQRDTPFKLIATTYLCRTPRSLCPLCSKVPVSTVATPSLDGGINDASYIAVVRTKRKQLVCDYASGRRAFGRRTRCFCAAPPPQQRG